MTTSPPSLQQKCPTTFLENGGFNVQPGPWTLEGTCHLVTAELFLSATCIDLLLTAVEETERQIQDWNLPKIGRQH